MILPNFKAFPAKGTLIGIDWGARRTGVAVSDPTREFVFARGAIVAQNSDELIGGIINLLCETGAVGIVIGLPLRIDGTDSETTAQVRNFAGELAHLVDLPIVFVDETLTSTAAQEQMGRVRQADIKKKLDSNSARVILENAIAMIRRN